MTNGKVTTDAVEILHRRYIQGKPEMEALVAQERVHADVAHKIYELRTGAGLTQQQLAKKVGTTTSVICRLEDADYDGHSLTMLRRIAAAVGQQVEVNFVSAELAAPPAARAAITGRLLSEPARSRKRVAAKRPGRRRLPGAERQP